MLADGESAVIEAPPEAVTASPEEDITIEAGPQRWEFRRPDAPKETAPAPPEPPVQTEAAAPEPVEDSKPEVPDDPDPDLIERILKHPNAQQRIDQLTNNRFGNRLQQATAAAEQAARQKFTEELQKWDEATQTYNRLLNDDDYHAAMVRENGEDEVLAFRSNYIKAAKARNQAPQAPAFDATAYQRQFTEAFNGTAIDEFKNTAKAVLPFYGELPPEVRARVEQVAYNPDGNWLADAMTALGKGVSEHIAGLQRKHDAALREAVEAGKNEAVAAREESTPLTMTGEPGDMMSWQEIETLYAEGRLPGGWQAFQQAKRKFGKTD